MSDDFRLYFERRRGERRAGTYCSLSYDTAVMIIKAQQYTGQVIVHYANGIPKELHFPGDPVRIRLDLHEPQPETEA